MRIKLLTLCCLFLICSGCSQDDKKNVESQKAGSVIFVPLKKERPKVVWSLKKHMEEEKIKGAARIKAAKKTYNDMRQAYTDSNYIYRNGEVHRVNDVTYYNYTEQTHFDLVKKAYQRIKVKTKVPEGAKVSVTSEGERIIIRFDSLLPRGSYGVGTAAIVVVDAATGRILIASSGERF